MSESSSSRTYLPSISFLPRLITLLSVAKQRLRLGTFVVVSLTFVGLNGCTAVTEETRVTLAHAFHKPEGVELSVEEVADFPYTAIYARWSDSPQALLVLGYIDGQRANAPTSGPHTAARAVDRREFSWVSTERETLVTRQGRVVRTAGVDFDLLGVSNLANDPLRCVVTEPDSCSLTWQRAIDVETQIAHQRHLDSAYTREVRSHFSVLGQEQLELAAGVYDVTRVEEHGVVKLGGREDAFTNTFWIEADGHVVKSLQQVVPGRASLELTQMKWVGR